jgi:hypothetical protein
MKKLMLLALALVLATAAWAEFTDFAPGSNNNFGDQTPVTVPDSGVWFSATALPTGRSGAVSVYGVQGGKKYIFTMGGNPAASNNAFYKWDDLTNTWITLPNLPTGTSYASGVSVGGKIYLFGGASSGSVVQNITQIYNLADSTWSTGATMPTASTDHVTVVYQDSLIYLVGGITVFWTGQTNAVQIYNRNSNTWLSGTVFPALRGCGGGGIIGNTIVYSCGYTGAYVAETYEGVINPSDPTQITWTLQTAYPGGATYRVTGGPYKNLIFVGAGSTGAYQNLTYGYNPASHAWTQYANRPTALANCPNFVNVNDTLHTVGGYIGSYLTTHEALDLHGSSGVESPEPVARQGGLALTVSPNPSRGGTSVEFSLPVKGEASLKVYDAQGRLVKTLASGTREAGAYRASLSGLSAGVYFLNLQAGSYRATRNLVVVR